MIYGSVCSGIEAAGFAWKHLGWIPSFLSEVDPFPSAVLAARWGATKPKRPLDPEKAKTDRERKLLESWIRGLSKIPEGGTLPNLGDFTQIERSDYGEDIDLLVGGCPCQAFSVAGLRQGLDDPRGNLTLEFAKLAYRTHTRWLVWENVPGALSSGKGCDFASFLSALAGWEVPVPEGGWKKAGLVTNAPGAFGVAWRVLDAQYTRVPEFPRAVPQRRRRVLLVGYLGSWENPAKVLFDRELCGGNTPPSRKAWKKDPADSGREPCENCGGLHVLDTRHLDSMINGASPTLLSSDYKGGKAVCRPTICYENHANDSRVTDAGNVSPSITSRAGTGGNNLPLVLTVDPQVIGFVKNDAGGTNTHGINVSPTLRSSVMLSVASSEPARKFMPVECERLMGFPDDYTRISWGDLPEEKCPDSHRYRVLGNSMAVNVMAWIGRRIEEVEESINGSERRASGETCQSAEIG